MSKANSHILAFFIAFFCIFSIKTTIHPAFVYAAPQKSSIVIDADTGKILHSYNGDEVVYPASLTKMMTLYITFAGMQKGLFKRDDALVISKKAATQPRTKMDLIEGETITIDSAIKGLIIKSANDAATVLAENISASETEFAKIMTKTAQELGMKNTVFKNASGLNNGAQQTTAGDMAMLMMALQQHFPEYYKYFSVKSFKYHGDAFYNYSKIINGYEGCDGVKTGYIEESGFNLLASAKKGNNRIIAVLFGAKNQMSRDEEMKQLLDYGFIKIKDSAGKNIEIAKIGNNNY